MSDATYIVLEQRIAVLERQVQALFAALDPANARPTTNIDPETGEIAEPISGTVPRGKYAGRKCEMIVRIDPHHVVWLADNAKAFGLGYTHEDIDKARELVKTVPDPHKKRGSYR